MNFKTGQPETQYFLILQNLLFDCRSKTCYIVIDVNQTIICTRAFSYNH